MRSACPRPSGGGARVWCGGACVSWSACETCVGARGRWRGGEVVHECECVALLADVRVLGMCCSRECGGLRLGWQYSRVRVGDEVV